MKSWLRSNSNFALIAIIVILAMAYALHIDYKRHFPSKPSPVKEETKQEGLPCSDNGHLCAVNAIGDERDEWPQITRSTTFFAQAWCYWIDGEKVDPNNLGLTWNESQEWQTVTMVRKNRGLIEACTVVFDQQPFQCYGYTASYCDESYQK